MTHLRSDQVFPNRDSNAGLSAEPSQVNSSQDSKRSHAKRQGFEAVLRYRVAEREAGCPSVPQPLQPSQACQVKPSQVESSQVKSSRVESSRVESSRVESSQVKSSRVKSSEAAASVNSRRIFANRKMRSMRTSVTSLKMLSPSVPLYKVGSTQ